MVDLPNYVSITWLGLKPFYLNFFKTGVIILCVVAGREFFLKSNREKIHGHGCMAQ